MNLCQSSFPALFRTLAIFACIAVPSTTLPTQSANGQSASKVVKIREIEGLEEYRLENGIPVIFYADDSKQQFTLNMTVFVGSRHEGYGETGMAHLLEHMLFKGTTSRKDIGKLIGDRGALNLNGTTWYDRTNYYETLPTSDDNLKFAIEMEADRLLNSLILGEDLASEMTVVRNEFEQGENNARSILLQRIYATAYEWHNYGKNTIGNRADIERVPVNNLRAFYKKYYRPDNISLCLAGNFDKQQALDYLSKYFGQLKIPKTKIPQTYTEEPVQDGERIVSLKRSGDMQFVGVGYHIPSSSHEDFAACEVLGSILGDVPSGILYKELVEAKLASQSSCMSFTTHDPGLLTTMVGVPKDVDLNLVSEKLLEILESKISESVDEASVKRVVTDFVNSRELQMNDSEALVIELSEWFGAGDWRLYFLHRDRVKKVTVEDVKRVAKKYFLSSNRTVGYFHPTQDPVRSRVPITVRKNLKKELASYKGGKKVKRGEAFTATPANIKARAVLGELDCGLKYAIFPKKTRGETLLLSASLNFGNEKTLFDKDIPFQILGYLMGQGTKQLSFQEFSDRCTELKANMSAEASIGSLDVGLQTKLKNLDESLVLLKQMLREPALPENEFNVMKGQFSTFIEASKSDPQMLAQIELARRSDPFEKDNIRYSPTIEETVEMLQAVTIEDVREAYRMVGAQNGYVIVLGDVDPDEIVPQLEALFADWKTDFPYTRIESTFNPNVAGQRFNIETPDKKNALYMAAINLPMSVDHEDYTALKIGNYILGGGALSSRLADRVRKKEGLSYGVSASFTADWEDKYANLSANAITNPGNMEKVVAVINEEMTRWLNEGITEEELERAKVSYLKTVQGSRASDNAIVSMLASNFTHNRTMDYYAESDQRILDLTVEQVNAAIKRHIDLEKLIVVTAGDFANAQEDDK